MLLSMLLLLMLCPSAVGESAGENPALAAWEAQYGPHQYWDYHLNAAYTAAFGAVPGCEVDQNFTATEPDETAIPCDAAVAIARAAIATLDTRFTPDYLDSLRLGTEYHTDVDSAYLSPQGTWIVSFWQAGQSPFRRAFVYVNPHSEQVPLVMDAYDVQGAEDYDRYRYFDMTAVE